MAHLYYGILLNNKILLIHMTQVYLRSVKLSDRIQTQKNKFCIIAFYVKL